MGWQITYEGSKEAVAKAVQAQEPPAEIEHELPEGTEPGQAFDIAKAVIVDLIKHLPAVQTGVYVNAVGTSNEINIFEVRGRALTL